MVGNQERGQDEFFIPGSVRDLIPDDHILKRVDEAVDFSWMYDEVRDCYNETQGRPSIDPESALRLMLAGFFQGVVHDRKLMREAQVNVAIRWFAGYRLDERLPHHSSLTRIRQRWGAQRFRRIFQRTVEACVEAGLVDGETVHVDATLIRANVSWESLTEQHAEQVWEENELEEREQARQGGGPGRKRSRPRKPKKRSRTDPDATLTTSQHNYRMEPSYKQHTAVDDLAGVVVDVEVTTGEASEGKELLAQIGRVQDNTGRKVRTTTADVGYAHSANYAQLEEQDIEAVIPPQSERKTAKRLPIIRFKYDSKHELLRCPQGKYLVRNGRGKNGWWYRAKTADCQGCALRKRCLAQGVRRRSVLIVDGYEALLRARRRRRRWDERTRAMYQRHRWRVEGVHGEAKTQHGLRRAVRWGLTNVAIQAYLTAAVINLKRLARHSGLNRLCERLICAVNTAHNGLLAVSLETRSVGVRLRLATT